MSNSRNEKPNDKIEEPKNSSNDPRKIKTPGYDEKNPSTENPEKNIIE